MPEEQEFDTSAQIIEKIQKEFDMSTQMIEKIQKIHEEIRRDEDIIRNNPSSLISNNREPYEQIIEDARRDIRDELLSPQNPDLIQAYGQHAIIGLSNLSPRITFPELEELRREVESLRKEIEDLKRPIPRENKQQEKSRNNKNTAQGFTSFTLEGINDE